MAVNVFQFKGLEKDATTRKAVVQALGSAISVIWLAMTPFLGVSFILGEPIDKRTLIANTDGPKYYLSDNTLLSDGRCVRETKKKPERKERKTKKTGMTT